MDNNTMSGAGNFSGIAGQDTMAPQGTMPVAPKKKKTGLILGLSLGIGGYCDSNRCSRGSNYDVKSGLWRGISSS